jgi:hypothetical protein
MSVFAVFVVVRVGNGYAATTRTDGRIGLPGGKIDPGEQPLEAAKRESYEEGWNIDSIDAEPKHKAYVDGKEVWWFIGNGGSALTEYKEKYRGIKPIIVSIDDLIASGYGNEWIEALKTPLSVTLESLRNDLKTIFKL